VCSPPALLLVFLDLLCVVVCGDRFTSRAISKAGGRVFDIDVDVVDPYAAQLLEGLNVMSAAETNMETTIEQVSDAIEVNCSGSGQLTDCRLYIYLLPVYMPPDTTPARLFGDGYVALLR
jgi:hypothetical protein